MLTKWLVLDNINLNADEQQLSTILRLKPASPRRAELFALISEARALARPRAIYAPLTIEQLDETGLTVGGIRFTGSLFKPYLQAGQQIWPFLATAGSELAAWCQSHRADNLRYYWTTLLAGQALSAALAAVEAELAPTAADVYLAAFNPGSLPAWPLEQQKPLFKLFGERAAAVGVTLTEQCLMLPQKTVSGFYFHSARAYNNCQLCPRPVCELRRAEFVGKESTER